jgi:hypothetical protein
MYYANWCFDRHGEAIKLFISVYGIDMSSRKGRKLAWEPLKGMEADCNRSLAASWKINVPSQSIASAWILIK